MYGFIRVACASPRVKIGDCEKNAQEIISIIERASKDGVSLLVLPELCITGYTCSDLFFQSSLQNEALKALANIGNATKSKDLTVVVGLPYAYKNSLYNVAAICSTGRVQALVPKTHIPNYAEFYEKRHFSSAFAGIKNTSVLDDNGQRYEVPFGTNLLFSDKTHEEVQFAVEICEDLWVSQPPSVSHTQSGAIIIANISASNETIGKYEYRRLLIKAHSARHMCAYVYADAGRGESSTDLVFAGHNIIGENERILAENIPFEQEPYCYSDVDTERLLQDRRKNTSFSMNDRFEMADYKKIYVTLPPLSKPLSRIIASNPFIPANADELNTRCKEIISIQAESLMQRLNHIGCKTCVIGISGGLDSTHALLIAIEAFKRLKLDLTGIIAITMPCFGTSDRTYQNACSLAKETGITLREIPIAEAVLQHFKDISHNPNEHDATYENSQARERTQILMDIANSVNGIVIGTGDLSELALGWATFNGDHMSMYGVNASVPKTLMRHLVSYYENCSLEQGKERLAAILHDVLETPVSPELLPNNDGKTIQATESILGSYELHDFFLYYFVRWGFSAKKILFLAENAFMCGTKTEMFSRDEIKKRLVIFLKRFFSQQFKRSCLPDGPKIGSISLSPRGDWRMPSDAHMRQWLESLEG